MSINDSNKDWYVIDATDVVLGRLASKVAHVLKGKHKPQYQPHTDEGDYIIVINAKKIKVTGNKLEQKKYYRHSGYHGGLKETTLEELLAKHPDRVIKQSVKGMLPKTVPGKNMFSRLKVYANDEHPHQAQNPQLTEL